jgi:hypothetical protein
LRFIRIFVYFAARGAFFNILRYLKRDRLNLHYVDALKRLKHKVRISDILVLKAFEESWQTKILQFPRERRVFLGLQLFPEASLDYWLCDLNMVRHDEAVVRYCEVFGAAGYVVMIKDHPLQFGFRQRDLIDRLAKLPFVVLIPYGVSAHLLLSQSGVSVTFTGTIGFQAALAGICSVVSEPYYADQLDPTYVQVRQFNEIEDVVSKVQRWQPAQNIDVARCNILRHLARGSVPGDYFSWRNFSPDDQSARERVRSLAQSLNKYLPQFLRRGDGGDS